MGSAFRSGSNGGVLLHVGMLGAAKIDLPFVICVLEGLLGGRGDPRCLVFFENRNFFEEVQNFFEIKNLGGWLNFVASGTASFRVPAWPVSPVC